MAAIPGVYKITCHITGQIYFGSSLDVFRRLTDHKLKLKTNKHHNQGLQQLYNQYGVEFFSFDLVEVTQNVGYSWVVHAKIKAMETQYIEHYRSIALNVRRAVNVRESKRNLSKS